MSKNTSITLNPQQTKFIKAQVKAGRYASASEVLREGLRRLQDDETHLKALRKALEDGENSGPPQDFDLIDFLAEVRREDAA